MNVQSDLSTVTLVVNESSFGSPCTSLFLYPTDVNEIFEVVKSLETSKSVDYNEVSSMLMKNCINLFSILLVH